MFLKLFFGIETMENHNVQCWVNQLDPGIAPFGSFAHCAAWQGIQLVENPGFLNHFLGKAMDFHYQSGLIGKPAVNRSFGLENNGHFNQVFHYKWGS